MASNGKARKVQRNGEEVKRLTVEVFGVSMLLANPDKVVLPDGRRPRVASDGKSPIPTHIAFIALDPDSYDRSAISPSFSFQYDVNGGQKDQPFDAFLLDQSVVTFEGVKRSDPKIKNDNIPSIADLLGDSAELCPSVWDGSSKNVVGTIELAEADTIEGRDHGDHLQPVTFGSTKRNWAETVVATFLVGEAPAIRVRPGRAHAATERGKSKTNGHGNGNGNGHGGTSEKKIKSLDVTIPLKGDHPPYVVIANVPPEELMKLNMVPEGQGVSLSHLELLYDFFHFKGTAGPPKCDDHAFPHTHAPKPQAQGAHGMRIAGDRAHCGPPVK